MKNIFVFVFCFLIASSAAAQVESPFFVPEAVQPQALGEVWDQPSCFNIVNKAPYTVFGTINTEYFIRADGIKTRHQSNFRLIPDQYREVCTTGPFFEGGKVELVLRTLFPIFRCKTGPYGNIVINGRILPEGGTETTADCMP